MNRKKVFVSGCYDLLHSGHIAFFEEAAGYGDLYVGIGSDKTIFDLKNRKTVYNEKERLYMIKALRFVKDAWINKGSGLLDFTGELQALHPDIFFVNEDGDTPAKRELCRSMGIDYVISQRIPKENLPVRSTTGLRSESTIPYRLDLAGGWLDQPFVSKYYPGPVLTISVEPTRTFNDRSGMSTSTRKKAIELWGYRLPDDDPEKLSKVLFSYENPPGKTEISGSQDSLGIVLPGLNRLNYDGGYWPVSIESCIDEDLLSWLETKLHFIPLTPRKDGYNVLSDTNINKENAKLLSDAAIGTWNAVLTRDVRSFGEQFRLSLEAQVKMFPHMMNNDVSNMIDRYKDVALGWKLSGAGGGGYLVLIADQTIEGSFQIQIRRK